jgi:hypothetical protein
MARHYVIIKQECKWSKHGGQVTEISMVGLDDRKLYTTWIDPTNMNAKYWSHILRSPEHGFVITGVKTKRMVDRDDVINADSKPIIAQEHIDIDEMLNIIMEHWNHLDGRNRAPSFSDLFRGPDA